MRDNNQQASLDPLSAFKYVGDDSAVDFVNTVDWTGRGLELDRFTSMERVLEWGEGARLLPGGAVASLRAMAAERPAAARRVLRDAVELRGVLERLFAKRVDGSDVGAEIAQLNSRWLRAATNEMALVPSGAGYEIAWPRVSESLDSILWLVASSAARLLASSDLARLHRCGGPDCGWFYVDRSRNGLRRWCEMETCGTKMKSRRRAARNTYVASKDVSNA